MSNLKVIFEDNHLLVVDKPPLLATMGKKDDEDSLYRQAQEYLRTKYNKPGNVFVGVVSRLDSFVSGVIVLARTSKAASRLSQQLRDGTVDKKYWAIVPDNLPDDAGNLVDRLVKNEARHRMEVVSPKSKPSIGEQEARLHFTTLSRANSLCLIEVKLETGRKHQIRVQFENAGCPIVGDKKYGSDIPFKRGIALHSRRLTIEHPTKKVLQSFESEPPTWWNLGRFE